MKNLLWLPILLLMVQSLTAQPAKVLRNKHVVWAGYIEQDLVVDNSCSNDGSLNEMLIQKFTLSGKGADFWEDNFLASEVLEAAEMGNLQIFRDPDCLIQTTMSGPPDTLVTYDPETYEEQVLLLPPIVTASEVVRWRVHALLYYNDRSAYWEITDVSVAPMIMKYNPADWEKELSCLFWFKANSGKQHLRRKNTIWAKQLVPNAPSSFCFPETTVPLKNLRPNDSPFQIMLDACLNRKDLVFFNTGKYGGHAPMTPAEKEYLFLRTDTIAVFDPVTYEELETLVRNTVSIDALRLVELWSWNKQKNRLSIRVTSSAPIHYNLDSKGALRYYQPLFYRRN